MKQSTEAGQPLSEAARSSIFAFEAPYLVEKLFKEGIVDSSEKGEELLLELKRWLLLAQSDRSKRWPMYSARVDEVWHYFILYTREYTAFCEQYFGHYVHHSPSNAPKHPDAERPDTVPVEVFQEEYRRAFGEPAPEVWHEASNVGLHRRVANTHAGQLQIRVNDLLLQLVNPEARRFLVHDENQTCHLLNAQGAEILRVGPVAGDALKFLAETPSFYVRELPGKLEPAEKIALISKLVELGILKVTS